jgi:hypothetical protein
MVRVKKYKWRPSKGMMYLEKVPEGQRFHQPYCGYGTVISQSTGAVTVIWDERPFFNQSGVTEMRKNVRELIAPRTEVIKKKYEITKNRSTNKKEAEGSGKNSPESIGNNGRRENNKRAKGIRGVKQARKGRPKKRIHQQNNRQQGG